MINPAALSDNKIKKFVRRLSVGEMLFKQGDMGNTMFVIVDGAIEVVETRDNKRFTIGVLSAGEILGEKAIISEAPYRRSYSAVAKEKSVVLEFDTKSIRLIEAATPNFTVRILQIAAQRLDRSNRLITLLRSMDPLERFINAVLFHADESGVKGPSGIEIAITEDSLSQTAAIPKRMVDDCVITLNAKNILKKTPTGFVLTDRNALFQYLPELRERVAA